jgi:Arc/MetJ family transcription regulator
MRTNIDIDDKLMRQAMNATGTKTKKAAVEASLRKLIEVKARERALDEAMRLQEEGRLAAIHEGRLEEWHAELVRAGSKLEEPVYADQH